MCTPQNRNEYSFMTSSTVTPKKRPVSALFSATRPRDDIMVKRESYFQGISPSKEAVLTKLGKGCIKFYAVVELRRMSGRDRPTTSNNSQINTEKLSSSFKQQGHIPKYNIEQS